MKCFLSVDNEDRFLVEQCSSFARDCLVNKIITGWFFVRYGDANQSHLRLRFRGETGRVLTQLIPAIHEWSNSLVREHLIQEMAFSTYEREVERYGGEELIESTETLFCADTETTSLLIRSLLEKKTSLAEEVLAALSLIDLLKGLGLSIIEQIAFFSSLEMDKNELAGFREWKRPLLSLGDAIFRERLASESDTFFLHEAFQKRAFSLQAHASLMRDLEEKLTEVPHSIYNSILHMHCNRLVGRSRKEQKARLYAYHTLLQLQEKRARLNNEKNSQERMAIQCPSF